MTAKCGTELVGLSVYLENWLGCRAETVRDCGNCLVGRVDLVASVCRRWLHCHLWVEVEAKVSEIFGFVEWQWVGGVVKRELCCQPEE